MMIPYSIVYLSASDIYEMIFLFLHACIWNMFETENFVVNVSPFLVPYEAFRIMPRLSSSTAVVFKATVQSSWWESPCLQAPHNLIDDIKVRLSIPDRKKETYSMILLHLLDDPIQFYLLRATNEDMLVHVLARRGDVGLLELIARMTSVFDPNDNGAGGMTLLHCVAFSKSREACKFLVRVGADPNIRDAIGRLPEDWATVQQAHELATFLRHCRKGKVESQKINCTSWLHSS